MADRFIDILEKATRKGLLCKEIKLPDGSVHTVCYAPKTLAESDAIRKDIPENAGGNEFALQLMVQKALDTAGQRLFSPADLPRLRRAVEQPIVEQIMLAIVADEGELQGVDKIDSKSPKEAT